MLRTTDVKETPSLAGINQQDFSELQLVQGTFPYQQGLQKRVPGKTLQRIFDGPVSGIYVFYGGYARGAILVDFGTSLRIIDVPFFPVVLPALPPDQNIFDDNFSGYLVDTISPLWGAGNWFNSVGVCQTIIQGYFDPFQAYPTTGAGLVPGLAPGAYFPPVENQPIKVPNGIQIPATTPVSSAIPAPALTSPNSRVYYGSMTIGPNYFVFPNGNYPMDNSGWLPGGHGDLPFISHPYPYNPGLTNFFAAQEDLYANSFYNSSSQVQEVQTSTGWYSDNLISLQGISVSNGQVVTLYGTQVTQTDRFGATATQNIEVPLGIFPNIPARFTVRTGWGPKISNDISSPPGSNRQNISKRTISFTGINVYPL